MDQTDENRGLFPGLNTLQDRLALAVSDGSQYLAEPLDVQKADAFARSAHILAEWVVKDHGTFGYQSEGDCREDIYKRCPDLKAIRDFSNRSRRSYPNRTACDPAASGPCRSRRDPAFGSRPSRTAGRWVPRAGPGGRGIEGRPVHGAGP